MELEKPSFIFHFVKRSNPQLKFIETTLNKYNISTHVVLRGFENVKHNDWTYIIYDTSARVTLHHRLRNRKKLYFNEISSPFVAVNFNTITSFNGMFVHMDNVEEIFIENFDTSNIVEMNDMFALCSSLKKVTIKNCDLSGVESMTNLCHGCNALNEFFFINCKFNVYCDFHHAFSSCVNLNVIQFPVEIYTPIAKGNEELTNLPEIWKVDISSYTHQRTI